MFERLGEWICRWWYLVLLFWAVLLAVLELTAPNWDDVTRDGDLRYIPDYYQSVRGRELLRGAFGTGYLGRQTPEKADESPGAELAASRVVIVAERPDGSLRSEDFRVVDDLVNRLSTERDAGLLPIERIHSHDRAVPPSSNQAIDSAIGSRYTSPGPPTNPGQATLVFVSLQTEFLDKRNIRIVGRIEEIVNEVRRSSLMPEGLRLELGGEAAVGHDILVAAEESDRRTQLTTIFLVTLILLLVYRAPVLALIPLVTIGVAVKVSLNLVALLAQVEWLGFHLFSTTQIYVVVVLFGAGTDYCLFLLARFREELRIAKSPRDALGETLGRVGGAVTASAGTVMCGLGMMVFAEFGKFRYSGITVAISLFVALCAALTLSPALLRVLGHRINRPLRARGTVTYWDRLSGWLAARPGVILLTSVALLLPLAVIGTHPQITYDLLSELAPDRLSRRGMAAIQRYFNDGELSPVTVLLDARQTPGAPIDFASKPVKEAIQQLEDGLRQLTWKSGNTTGRVAEVRSLTNPLGTSPEPSAGAGTLSGVIQFLQSEVARDYYVSSQPGFDKRVARIEVVFNSNPFSGVSLDGLPHVEQKVRELLKPPSPLAGVQPVLAGFTAETRDLRTVTVGDQFHVDTLVIAGIFVILVVLLRRPGVCFYLVATVVFGYLVTLGTTEVVFRTLAALSGQEFQGLDWKVPLFLFTILVAVGEDYNIFLMSRVKEEQAAHGPTEGIRRALAQTGGIISSCGVIMAGTFISLMSGSLMTLLQLGFALGFGVLLDTFVVRPVLVPAFMLLWDRRRLMATQPKPDAPRPPEPVPVDQSAGDAP